MPSTETGRRYREAILEAGGSRPAMESFKAFRGREPSLDALLRQLPACLKPNGRVAILTFHSGEDRRVKHAFAEGERLGLYTVVSDSVRRPGPEELRSNPRSAPAKLRWAIRSSTGAADSDPTAEP